MPVRAASRSFGVGFSAFLRVDTLPPIPTIDLSLSGRLGGRVTFGIGGFSLRVCKLTPPHHFIERFKRNPHANVLAC
jgi:hypothetical protein